MLMTNLQSGIHFLECFVCLLEEAVYDALGELSLLLIVIHLQYLLEGQGVD